MFLGGSSVMYLPQLVSTVDDDFKRREELEEDGMRTHLGASILGDKCMRAVWFSFRWFGREEMEGRIYRLLSRGDREEIRFAELLRNVGADVWTFDPETGKQFRITEFGGHMGGSLDGVGQNIPHTNGEKHVLEFKTHNDKSFKDLQKKGVQASKPKHYAQAQVYMHKTGIKWALYCAVNKNDDNLHYETFALDPVAGSYLINRAESVIFGTGLPARISSNPGWFECTFCPHSLVCFSQKLPPRNCRTCRFATPLRNGHWHCQKFMAVIETSNQKLTWPCHEHMEEFARE